ncbi:hypothetical protein [Actinomadura sp. NPDC000600]|uniref:DUF6896 domain-containing protein n=1 Tax=Actinomadura sp. NPDC000600 TaxID=3154262 RepID=UPI0033918A20
MASRDIVLAFVRNMAELTAAVTRATRDDTGGDDIWSLVTAANQRRVPRERELPDGLRYSVHGAGCLITAPDGTQIDVDLGPEPPTLQFNAWRVRRFAESTGENSVTERELAAALEQLADEGAVASLPTTHDAWYTAVRAH